VADGPEPGRWKGLADLEAAFRERMSAWDDYSFTAEEIRDLDGERVVALNRRSGRGKASGLDIGQMQSAGVNLFHLREGKVTNLVVYWDRDRGLTDLGLEGQVVPDDSTTPDLVELSQRLTDAINAREIDAVIGFYAPDAVFDQPTFGVFEGRAAIRSFIEDWFGAYDEIETEAEERRDLGHGLAFVVYVQRGRLRRSTRSVHARVAFVNAWVDGLIQRTTVYEDIDEARASAERLAEERG
jgi:ketosteroid isomerase-like protein